MFLSPPDCVPRLERPNWDFWLVRTVIISINSKKITKFLIIIIIINQDNYENSTLKLSIITVLK
jgi:hypothetical protein